MDRPVVSHQPSAKRWDAHAKDYVELFAPLTGHVARAMVTIVQDRLPASPKLLDIACGPGDLAVAAAQLCAKWGAGSVFATDISTEMVATTERALASINAETQCEVRAGPAKRHLRCGVLLLRYLSVSRSCYWMAICCGSAATRWSLCDICLARPRVQRTCAVSDGAPHGRVACASDRSITASAMGGYRNSRRTNSGSHRFCAIR